MKRYYVLVFCLFYWILSSPITSMAQEAINLLEVYPNDQSAFTQGLEVHPEMEPHQLLMGTGLYGESSIGVLDLKMGQYRVIDALEEKYFGEGLTVADEAIWQLTWKEGTAFKRDLKSFAVLEAVDYSGQGWGLAYDSDRQQLWMSDGSSQLTIRDKETFEVLNTIEVTYNQQAVTSLNELEFANGLIYANIWLTNKIVAINPADGQVEYIYDLSDLIEQVNHNYSEEITAQMDVLNGIAHLEDNIFYLTGKHYPYVLKVELPR